MLPLEMADADIAAESQGKISDLLAKASRSPARALLLDYDGTLAPFSEDRQRAAPYPEIPALLDRIRTTTNTHLVVITGRRATEVSRLLGLKKIEVWGCHGLSRLHSNGMHEIHPVDERTISRISEANELLRSEGLFDLLELKPAGVAIHWRAVESAMAKQVARKVRDVWSMLPSREGLELLKFDGGMEIRVALRNKGDAVRTILTELGKDAVIAYLGDDQTDEDAFEALRGDGLGILVSREHRPTAADAWVLPREGVTAFLLSWIIACGGTL